MVPKIMMHATRPRSDIIPIFQTVKILQNLPPHMLEPLQKTPEEEVQQPAASQNQQTNSMVSPALMLEEKKPMAEDVRLKNFLRMALHEKDQLTCDDVFALYLGYVSKQVNAIYYRTVTKFVFLYRECMNQKGWHKRREFQLKAGMSLDDDPVWLLAHNKEKNEGVPEMPWIDKNEGKADDDIEDEDASNDEQDGEERKLDDKGRSPQRKQMSQSQ